MTRSVPVGEVRLLGDRALLVGVADAPAGRRLGRALQRWWTGGAVEIVGGFATVMVALCDPGSSSMRCSTRSSGSWPGAGDRPRRPATIGPAGC